MGVVWEVNDWTIVRLDDDAGVHESQFDAVSCTACRPPKGLQGVNRELNLGLTRFLEHVIAAGELSQHGQFPLAFRRLLQSVRVRQGILAKPFTGDVVVNELQRRGLAVSLLSLLASQYSALAENSLLEAYESLSTEIAQHINGAALQRVRAGNFKMFAESTPYNALVSTVHMT